MASNAAAAASAWRVLGLSRAAKVNLQMTLCGGQCFSWYPTPRHTFVGALGHSVFELREVQCGAKTRTQHAVETTAARPPSRGARKGASAANAAGASCSCCWVEYRRLWPDSAVSASEKPPRATTRAPPGQRASKGRTTQCADDESDEAMLSRYLALDVDLGQLWERWTDAPRTRHHPLVTYLIGNRRPLQSAAAGPPCPHDTALANLYVPIRHLRQDLHSCLFAFLCSQNNNVARITGMVYNLCRAYGDPLCDVQLSTGAVRAPHSLSSRKDRETPRSRGKVKSDLLAAPSLKPLEGDRGSTGEWLALYSFPSLEQLSSASEEQLRKLGFGYRSKYTVDAVQLIAASPASHAKSSNAASSRSLPLQRQHGACHDNGFYASVLGLCGDYRRQREMLLRLPGVGRKVADCVALFALGCTDVVPVDTHMAQVAVEYLAAPAAAAASTPAVHKSRKRLRGEEEVEKPTTPATSWNDVLLDWGKQADALRLKKKREEEEPRGKRAARPRGPVAAAASPEKTAVPALYERHHDAIQEGFRVLFGDFAGWAHSILFYYRMRKP